MRILPVLVIPIISEQKWSHGILFINPGSIRLPRGRKERTYVILEMLEECLSINVSMIIDRGEIKELAQHFSSTI